MKSNPLKNKKENAHFFDTFYQTHFVQQLLSQTFIQTPSLQAQT